MKKTLVALILLVCMLTGLTAQAETTITPFASECIRSYVLSIYAKSNGEIEASGSVSCNNQASKIILTVKIQEKQNGSWVTVATAPNSTVYNAYSHATSTTYSGTIGNEYRATLSLSVTYNGTTETRSVTSATKTAKK